MRTEKEIREEVERLKERMINCFAPRSLEAFAYAQGMCWGLKYALGENKEENSDDKKRS